MNPSLSYPPPAAYPPGVGYLTFMGYVQIVVGVLTALFSAVALFQSTMVDPQLFSPLHVAEESRGFFGRLIAGYIVFQMTWGWLLGSMMVIAGICCLHLRGRAFVTLSSLLNLVNFPHGTTAGIMMLHGYRRQEVLDALHRPH